MNLEKYKKQIINSFLISKFIHFKYFYDISDLQQLKIIFLLNNINNIKKLKNQKKYKFFIVQQQLFLYSNLYYITKQKPQIKKKKYLKLNKKKKKFFFFKQILQLHLNKINLYLFLTFFCNLLFYEKLQSKLYKKNLNLDFNGFKLQTKTLITNKFQVQNFFIKFLFFNKFFGFNFLYFKLQVNLKKEILWILNQKYLLKNNYIKLFFTKKDIKTNIFILQLLHIPIFHELYNNK